MILKCLDIKTIFMYSILSAIIWGAGFLISFLLPFNSLYLSSNGTNMNKSLLYQSMPSSKELSIQIINNNLQCVAINTLGFCSLGIITIINLFFNGFMHGYSIRYSISLIGADTLFKVLPHSFELIGIFVSGAVGLYSSKFLIGILFNHKNDMRKCFFTSIHFLIVSCIIIIVAGVVEGYISLYK